MNLVDAILIAGKHTLAKRGVHLCYLLFFVACTEPVLPEFEFENGLVYIDAFVSTSPGSSFVNIRETNFLNNTYSNTFVENAEVFFENIDSGESVLLLPEGELYVPNLDFRANTGETWKLNVRLENGITYESLPETSIEPVPISEIETTYDPELFFNESTEDFEAGHFISATFNDPPEKENYYFWQFQSFERLSICETCFNAIYRDGCQHLDAPFVFEFNYLCASDCWKIRFNNDIKIFSDEFSNGRQVNQLRIAEVPLYTKEDILVELRQYAISAAAYEYYRTLKDIIDNNGNFNAPPPATLLGNLFNPDDTNDFVLGRFTVASAIEIPIFIARADIEEPQIEPLVLFRPETSPPVGPFDITTTAPCRETRFTTGIRPENWVN